MSRLTILVRSQYVTSKQWRDIEVLLSQINQDIWNISALIARLSWMRERAVAGELHESIWMQYAALDIEHFHIELRSLFDYLARILTLSCPRQGVLPSDSFRALREGLAGKKGPAYTRHLGEDLAELVAVAPRFAELRAIRDLTVHRGGLTLVFGRAADGILFQVLRGWTNEIDQDLVMYNENVANFESYASDLVARLLNWLSNIAVVLNGRVPGDGRFQNLNSRVYSPGFPVILEWIQGHNAHLWSLDR